MSRLGGAGVTGGRGGDPNRCSFCNGTGRAQVDRKEMERNLKRFPMLGDKLGLGRSPAGSRYTGGSRLTKWGQVVPIMGPSPMGGGKYMTVPCMHCDGRGFVGSPRSSQLGTYDTSSKPEGTSTFQPSYQASVKRPSGMAGLAECEERIRKSNIERNHTEHSQKCIDVSNQVVQQEPETAPSSEKDIVTEHDADMNLLPEEIILEALREPEQEETDIDDDDIDFDVDIPF